MKTANEIAGTRGSPEEWLPMLELAVREVFQIMLSSQLQAANGETSAPFQFTAMVGLAGQLCGVLSLRCSAQSATLMVSKMLGVDLKEVDEQMWDAIGEVANMIAGNFKNKLTGVGEHCLLSVPTVITGSDYSCHSMADSGTMEVILAFEGVPISVSLELHS